MPIKVKFDSANIPEKPTFVLAYKNGKKIGAIEVEDTIIRDSMINPAEISFKVKKYMKDSLNVYWDYVKDFRLIWMKESDTWFELYVDIDESTETVKTVTTKQLGQAELGQIKLFSVEINTDNDIARDDYVVPTVLYREDHPEASLLHRILEKAPHYRIRHVDNTIRNIQRTFTFNNISIPDALKQVSDEIGCLVVYHSGTDKYGMIEREISLYDLQSNCMNSECHHRGEFTSICPKCGSTLINEGYGEDTTIFVTADELADKLTLTQNRDAVKNCFKLEAGDDLMTATIRNCNPNGSDYIWHITNELKQDMSETLRNKINEYDVMYQEYVSKYEVNPDMYMEYSALIKKYISYPNIEYLDLPKNGYSSLMEAIYHTIDMELFLKSGLMPVVEVSDTNAQLQGMLLSSDSLSHVAVAEISKISLATANNAVLSMAKVIIDSRYQVKIKESSLVDFIWTGSFIVTNYSDEEDTYITSKIRVVIDDNYKTFVEQKLSKLLSDEEPKDYSIAGLFKLQNDEFCEEIKKYNLDILMTLRDMAQICINFLIEQGVANHESWGENLYDELYTPRYNQLVAIENELSVRQSEVDLISGKYDLDGNLIQDGFQTKLLNIRSLIQSELDFEKFLGKDLWFEFCTYRREDLYKNINYISDGLTNSELVKKSEEFIDVANNEIRKSAELQHSIFGVLKNLLMIPKFKVLVNKFSTGNWLRVLIDKKIYKLRLLSYEINFSNTNILNVEFSDVLKTVDGLSDKQNLISKMVSMTTSYNATQKQASQGANSNLQMNKWLANGLDITTTKIINHANHQTQEWNSNGMLFREYNPDTELYSDEQLKIINSTIAFTEDNWKTAVTAVGKFFYTHPQTGELQKAYGINGEALVGKIILGESMGIYSSNGRLTFNDRGLIVTNDINTVSIDPNNESIISVTNKGNEKILSFDDDGSLSIVGKIRVKSIEFEDGAKIKTDSIDSLSDVALSGNYNELKNTPNFASVATSGRYSDLSGTPVIQNSVSSNNISNPVSGSAVYSYVNGYVGNYVNNNAVIVEKGGYLQNRILGTNSNGVTTWLTIEQLLEMLSEVYS